MKIFFGKISSKEEFKDQIEHGYYSTSGTSMFNGIETGDYAFIVAGGRIQLWKASDWSVVGRRLDFEVLIPDTGMDTKKLSAFRFFHLDIPLVVLTVRQTSKRAFFPIQFTKELTETMLRNPATYQDTGNFRKIQIIDSEVQIDKSAMDIFLYKKDKVSFAFATNSSNVFAEFSDNIHQFGSGQKKKDKTLAKIRDIKKLPHSFSFDEISILQLYDAFCCIYKSTPNEDQPEVELADEEVNIPVNHTKNIIFYGPPGTGKTYQTLSTTVKIIEPKFYQENASNREALKLKYNELKEKGVVDFVTFHQSFGYEDFVEGIKPIPPKTGDNDTDQMIYDIEDGIFKRICDSARGNTKAKASISIKDFKGKYFKISLGGKQRPDIHDWCLSEGYISISWGGNKSLKDLEGIQDWETFRDGFQKRFPDVVAENRYNIQAAYAFLNMRKGDMVIASKGNLIVDAIGIVTDNKYEYKEDAPFEYYHFRKVDWLVTNLNKPAELFSQKKLSQQTIYFLNNADIKKDLIDELLTPEDKKLQRNHVLIIDEINRGNISKIFGELITLIESDKRIGEPNETEVKLPYSKKGFTVPSNLYLIGTMNTADRSIALIDTALRRRFEFQEIGVNPDLLSPGNLLVRLWKSESILNSDEFSSKESKLKNLLGVSEYDSTKWNKIKIGVVKTIKSDYSEDFKDIQFKGVDLSKLLSTLNERIEFLFDRDHAIGHAYFMGINSLEELNNVFRFKIIPLLQEYFYNDWEKIQLLLGENKGWWNSSGFRFIKEQKSMEKLLFGEEIDEFTDRKLFTLDDEFFKGNYNEITNDTYIRIYSKQK